MRLNSLLILIFTFLSAFPTKVQCQIKFHSPKLFGFSYMGRINFTNPERPVLWQPGTNICFAFMGDSCGIILEDEVRWGNNHNYIQIVIDGISTRKKLLNKIDTIWVRGSSNVREHLVEVYKNTEANIGSLAFNGVLCTGIKKFHHQNSLKIECIGNSITCGTGSDLSQIKCGAGVWYDQHNAYLSYGAVLARKLKAQFMLSSVSGIGLTRSCCNNPLTINQVIDKIDMSGNQMSWDFNRYQPDIVTICIGQNDGVQEISVFVEKYVKFIQYLRSKYPKSHFIFLSSPMADSTLKIFMIQSLDQVVSRLLSLGEKNISSYYFGKKYSLGCDGHPSISEHEEIAGELEKHIRSIKSRRVVKKLGMHTFN